ncbi:MAG TPA: membrane dipeptidase [Bryobacteraceae bacterium]|nr:membrane dipeptidase [Bryobacteraceae bacterium]
MVAILIWAPLAGAQPASPPRADHVPLEPDCSCAEASDQPPGSYEIKLTSEQERRAQAVWRRSISIVAHDHCFHADDFRQQQAAGITVRTIKPTVDGVYWQGKKRFTIESEVDGWEERGRRALAILDREVARHGNTIVVRSVADIRRAKQENKQGVIYSFEGARPLAGKLDNVKMFYGLGLRDLQLYWAVPSPLKNRDGSLSDFGQAVLRELNRVGIVADLSHMSDAAFSQALDITTKPIVVSHCGVAAASGKPPRGSDDLSDEFIRRIARNGGAICLHFYEGYIKPRHGQRATLEDLLDHMDHIKKVAGIDSIALGVDYFPEMGWRWIEGAERMTGMPNVVREMVRRGYTDEEIEKVLGGNLMRVYQAVWGR